MILRLIAVLVAALWVLPAAAQGPSPPSPVLTDTSDPNYNMRPQFLAHWRAAIAKVRAGTGRAKLAFIGDSTTAGAGAGSGGTLNYNAAWAKGPMRGLGPLLAVNMPISDRSLFGTQGVTPSVASYATYDTRVVLGAGWAASQQTFGGSLFRYSTGSASTLAFTPVGDIDTFIIHYVKLTPSGTFTVNVDGAASLGTVNTAAAGQTMGSTTFNVTKGPHTINLNAQNDNLFYIAGIYAYDSTIPAVDFFQGGSSGAKATTWNPAGSSPWLPLAMLQIIAPDLTLINLTINDSNTPTAMASYTRDMQAIITAAQVSGDVVLMVGPPSSTTFATNGTLDTFVDALRSLAVTNNAGLVDLKTRWVSYTVTNALMPYFDTLHPGAVGYQDVAAAVARAIAIP